MMRVTIVGTDRLSSLMRAERMQMQNILDMDWFGHAGIILLIGAVVVPREAHRIMLAGAAATFGMAASIFVLDRPSYALLFALVIVALLLRLALRTYQHFDVRFSNEDRMLLDGHLGTMGPALARRLIDEGHWISATKGDVLVEESQAAPCLFFLASGTAAVTRDGVDVGYCSAGDLIGEGTALEGGAASGTVRLATNARLWFIPAERLRALLKADPEVQGQLQAGFARALRTKLDAANVRAASAEGS